MSEGPLMPKATAVWLVENTSLSFDQIADFCKLHPLEVKGIADGEVAAGIKGLDPIGTGQLTREEIEKARGRPEPPPEASRDRRSSCPSRSRQEGAALYAGVAPPGPPERDPLASAQPSGAEGRADHAPGRHHQDDHPAGPRPHPLELRQTLAPMDPVTLGLCSQIDLDFEVQRAAKERPPVEPAEAGRTLLPAEVSTAPAPPPEPFAKSEPSRRPQEDKIDVNSVFAKLKQLKRPADDDE